MTEEAEAMVAEAGAETEEIEVETEQRGREEKGQEGRMNLGEKRRKE